MHLDNKKALFCVHRILIYVFHTHFVRGAKVRLFCSPQCKTPESLLVFLIDVLIYDFYTHFDQGLKVRLFLCATMFVLQNEPRIEHPMRSIVIPPHGASFDHPSDVGVTTDSFRRLP
jgi:hypothetical protein